jgi:hypothetical protein
VSLDDLRSEESPLSYEDDLELVHLLVTSGALDDS